MIEGGRIVKKNKIRMNQKDNKEKEYLKKRILQLESDLSEIDSDHQKHFDELQRNMDRMEANSQKQIGRLERKIEELLSKRQRVVREIDVCRERRRSI